MDFDEARAIMKRSADLTHALDTAYNVWRKQEWPEGYRFDNSDQKDAHNFKQLVKAVEAYAAFRKEVGLD